MIPIIVLGYYNEGTISKTKVRKTKVSKTKVIIYSNTKKFTFLISTKHQNKI